MMKKKLGEEGVKIYEQTKRRIEKIFREIQNEKN